MDPSAYIFRPPDGFIANEDFLDSDPHHLDADPKHCNLIHVSIRPFFVFRIVRIGMRAHRFKMSTYSIYVGTF